MRVIKTQVLTLPKIRSETSDDFSIAKKFKPNKQHSFSQANNICKRASINQTNNIHHTIDEQAPSKLIKQKSLTNDACDSNKIRKNQNKRQVSNIGDFHLFGNECYSKHCKICHKQKPKKTKPKNKIISIQPIIQNLSVKKKQKHKKYINKKPLEFYRLDQHGYIKSSSNILIREEQQSPYQSKVRPRLASSFVGSRIHNFQRKFKTQQDLIKPIIIEIDGKVYQILNDQNFLLNDFQQQKVTRKLKSNMEIQQIVKLHENQQKIGLQKQKQREQFTQWINQYIHYDTVFFKQKNNQKNFEFLSKANKNQNKRQNSYQSYDSYQSLKKQKPSSSIKDSNRPISPDSKKRSLSIQYTQQDVKEIYDIKFPKQSEIEEMIQGFQPLSGEFTLQQLKNSKDFTREYSYESGKQFIYFGGYDKRKLQRKGFGIFITKKQILQGFWIKGNIIKGVQLKNHYLYKGDFKYNKKHGIGKCSWINGEFYVGQWAHGIRQGQGIWQSKNKTESYSGQWKNGQVCGHGKYIKQDSYMYTGSFINFRKHGRGKDEFPNGDTFQGDYLFGFPQGKGKYIWKDGLTFEGQFKKGMREGKGRLTKQPIFTIQGPFKNEKPNGICQLNLSNGDKFQVFYSSGINDSPNILSRYCNGQTCVF